MKAKWEGYTERYHLIKEVAKDFGLLIAFIGATGGGIFHRYHGHFALILSVIT